MPDLTLRNVRPAVAEHLQRLAELQGLAQEQVAADALAIGLDVIDERLRKRLLNTREQVALKEAIEHIEKVPDDAFGLIGRVDPGD